MSDVRSELSGDPLVRDYAGMTDAQVVADINSEYRERDKTSMTGSEVLNAIDKAEYLVLSDTDQDRVWQLLHLGDLNPFGVEADLLIAVFGSESDTITALGVVRKKGISRAVELGLGHIKVGHVERARA